MMASVGKAGSQISKPKKGSGVGADGDGDEARWREEMGEGRLGVVLGEEVVVDIFVFFPPFFFSFLVMEIRLEMLGWMDGWMAKVKFGDQIMEKFTWEGRRLWEFDVLNSFEGGYLGIFYLSLFLDFFGVGRSMGSMSTLPWLRNGWMRRLNGWYICPCLWAFKLLSGIRENAVEMWVELFFSIFFVLLVPMIFY